MSGQLLKAIGKEGVKRDLVMHENLLLKELNELAKLQN
jgi:hypothetical protein